MKEKELTHINGGAIVPPQFPFEGYSYEVVMYKYLVQHIDEAQSRCRNIEPSPRLRAIVFMRVRRYRWCKRCGKKQFREKEVDGVEKCLRKLCLVKRVY